MAKKSWDVQLDGDRHVVDLNHGEGLGKVTVFVDGQQVVQDRTASSADYRFEIAGHSAIVRIDDKLLGLQHDYSLIVDGKQIP